MGGEEEVKEEMRQGKKEAEGMRLDQRKGVEEKRRQEERRK